MLPQEIAYWKTLTTANQAGMGIHRSQFQAIGVMFDELNVVQDELLTQLRAEGTPDEFVEDRLELETELVGIHGIMAIFRYILVQRSDPAHYRRALDAADLIAANGYLT